MKNEEQKIRETQVRFILENDKKLTRQELDSYSITALTIIKTELEIKLNYRASKGPGNESGFLTGNNELLNKHKNVPDE